MAKAVKTMSEKNYGSVVIVDNQNKVIGICTERDILKKLVNQKLNAEKTKLEKIMTANPRVGKEVIISTGSIERPIVFGNNDTPGVVLASAAKEYLKVYGVLVGKKPLIFTNNDSAYETAIEFKKIILTQ